MKLNKSLNPNIYYCFGNKEDSLFLLKQGEINILVGDQVVSLGRLVMAKQTHSAEIKVIERADLGAGFLADKVAVPVVDGFVTNQSHVYIVIKGADCTPILVYAKSKNAVGACHSGREGTKIGIVSVLIKKMIYEYNLAVDDLVVMIGPAISGANYQVSEEIYRDFVDSTGIEQAYRFIDMQKVIVRDILETGIKQEQIVMTRDCTYANPNYFSYRRDKAKNRQLAIIGIEDEKIFE